MSLRDMFYFIHIIRSVDNSGESSQSGFSFPCSGSNIDTECRIQFTSIQFNYLPQKYKHTSTHKRIYCKVVWGIRKPERFICPHSNPIVLQKHNTSDYCCYKMRKLFLQKIDRNMHRRILVSIYAQLQHTTGIHEPRKKETNCFF